MVAVDDDDNDDDDDGLDSLLPMWKGIAVCPEAGGGTGGGRIHHITDSDVQAFNMFHTPSVSRVNKITKRTKVYKDR